MSRCEPSGSCTVTSGSPGIDTGTIRGAYAQVTIMLDKPAFTVEEGKTFEVNGTISAAQSGDVVLDVDYEHVTAADDDFVSLPAR